MSGPASGLSWIIEPLENAPEFLQRKMFGCLAIYVHGRMQLVLADQEPKQEDHAWNGALICTSREHHAELQRRHPELKPHPILGKWLYLSQRHPRFESVIERLILSIQQNDICIGIEPGLKKRKKRKERKKPGAGPRKKK